MLKPILVVLILLSLFFIGLNTVQADNDFSGQIKDVFSKTTGEAGYKTDVEVASLAGTIIKSIVALVGVAFLVLMIYGGILWLTAGGMEEQVSKSQKTISRAVIGFIIVLAAYGLTDYTVGKIITATGVDVKVKSLEISQGPLTSLEPLPEEKPSPPEPKKECMCTYTYCHATEKVTDANVVAACGAGTECYKCPQLETKTTKISADDAEECEDKCDKGKELGIQDTCSLRNRNEQYTGPSLDCYCDGRGCTSVKKEGRKGTFE